MILGIGTDIVEILRIKENIKDENFLNKCFTSNEKEYFKNHGFKAEHIAGCFAAKEAVSKCFGTGISGFKLKDIEVNHNENGKPFISLYNNALKTADDMGIDIVHLSISHTNDNAIAYAVAERR